MITASELASELRRLAADEALAIGEAWNALEEAADALDAMATCPRGCLTPTPTCAASKRGCGKKTACMKGCGKGIGGGEG